MKSKTARRASACVRKCCRSSNSHSRVAKKLSHSALSYASPTEPMDGRTPASRHRLPKATEVYWGEFKRSSQHLTRGGSDDDTEAVFGAGRTSQTTLARPPLGAAA